MRKRLLVLFTVIALLAILIPASTAQAAVVSKVICVPWQGDPAKYHTTYAALNVQLKGVIKTGGTGTIYYKWTFGDGTPDTAVASLSGNTKYSVEIKHTYSGATGTPFTAKLIAADDNVLVNGRIEDTYLVKMETAGLDAKINVAIDNGLWYLYKSGSNNSSNYHTFDNSPFMVWSYSSYFASPTASAVHAFEINGHKETGNKDEDPYAEYVEYGLNWLFNGWYYQNYYPMLQSYAIGAVPGGNPDTNGNGKGIEVRDYGYLPIYQGGMVMDAIISSGTPGASSGRDFNGDGTPDTYQQVIQDMCDMYGWGQYDSAYSTYGIIGGWRYYWDNWPDNSACQWAAIGMIPAQEPPWNCTVPTWVKTLNNNWLTYSYSEPWGGSPPIWGGFGYTGPSWGDALTPSGMVQLAFAGKTTSDTRWVRCERWFADNWVTTRNWLNQDNVYAYYAFAKAMRLAQPNPVVTFSSNNFDWYRGGGTTMGLAEKISNQLISTSHWNYYGEILGTAWCVIILKPVLFAAAPVACFSAHPNPNYPDQPIFFDPSCSGHSEPGKTIANLIKFEWDWDGDGVYDQFTTTPQVVTHSFPCATIPCNYDVKLRVTDDSGQAFTATYVMRISISNPPHPPVSKANGPYMVSLCPGDTLTLDGSGSYDPDEGQHEAGCSTCPNDTIIAWNWDLDGAPYTYTGPAGKIVSPAMSSFPAAGVYDIGLRVTDNTALAYPGSKQPNLTDENFGKVEVYNAFTCSGIGVQVGCNYANLTWEALSGGADKYIIYMSHDGVNSGFAPVGDTTQNSKTVDPGDGLLMGKTTYYRIMAVKGSNKWLSKAVAVTPPAELCNPTANPGGPYTACAGQPVSLDGSGSTAQVGVIVEWKWDLDNDGQYDDALGVKPPPYTWTTPGTYTIGLWVRSSDSLILTNTATTTVKINLCEPPSLCPDLYKWSTVTTPSSKWDPPGKVFWGWQQVRLKNSGKSEARNVKAKITCAPANVTILDGTVSFPDIAAGSSAWSNDDFALATDMTKLSNAKQGIVWQLEFDDVAGNHYVIQSVPQLCGQTITCVPAYLWCPDLYKWSTVTTPSSKWDPPGKVFWGWQQVSLKNNGTVKAFNVKAKITCNPANVTVLDGNVSFPDIAAGASAWSTDDFALKTDMTNPSDPQKGIVWQVEFDDAPSGGKHYIISNVPVQCGKIILCP